MVKFGNRKEENFVRLFFPFCYLEFDEPEKKIIFLFCFYEVFLFIFEIFNYIM